MEQLARLAAQERRLVIGLMSGTSADGIDAALVECAGGGPGVRLRVLGHAHTPYPPEVRAAVFALFDPARSGVDQICHMNFVLGECFAAAAAAVCRVASVGMEQVDLIGSHGQTIWHQPQLRATGGVTTRSTLQIGEAAVIADRTGCPVVADFRVRDVAAGGHGAPLVPYFDWAVLRHADRHRAAQNIGGIGNVTYIPAGAPLAAVRAFDTGPGNMVMDGLVSLLTGGERGYDADGLLARAGTVAPDLLAKLLAHPYLQAPPPKTTGREDFGLGFSRELVRRFGVAEGVLAAAVTATAAEVQRALDLVATATAFTARSIADAYRRWLPGPVDEVILSGGGCHNPTLLEMLRAALAPVPVHGIGALGILPEAKEAVAFALLANDAVLGYGTNVPGATGAGRPVVLGKFVPA